MDLKDSQYSKEEWIVHANYGVGQIKAIVMKSIQKKRNVYYRVETTNSVYWLPVQNSDVPYIRPIASEWQLKRARTILRKPPNNLVEDHKERKQHLSDLYADGSLYSRARLVRDLHGKLMERTLSHDEEEMYQKAKRALVHEWMVVEDIQQEKAESDLEKCLSVSVKKI